MKLIYRGQIIEYPSRPVTSYRQTSTVNWRYQTLEAISNNVSISASSYKPPRAINWRWQIFPAQ